MELRNKKWSVDQLLARRREVLALWPTGNEIDLDEAIDYRKGLPDHKSWVKKTGAARESGRVLVEGLVGHPTIEQTIEHLKFAEEAGVDLHTIIADTYSRRNMFAQAQKAVEEGLRQGRSMLNGCPIVVHGLRQARRITEASNSPMLYVSSMVEAPMLLAEMAMASGFQISNDSLDSLLKASKNYPLEEKLKNDQYSARLAGYYAEKGAPVHVKTAAHLAGWEPHGMRLVVGILQALLIAEQGVKHISIALGQVLHLVQDVAGLAVLRELAGDYLRRSGHHDVNLFITAYPYQGEWSRDLDRASAISAWASIIGIMGGADWIVVKSIEEAIATPTKHGAATSIKMAGQLLGALGKQRLQPGKELDLEREMLRLEVRAIVERVVELGEGDIAIGLPRAISHGVIDIPFQPWTHLCGKVLTVRDATGAIRYLEHGNVPLPKEVADYHREMILVREKDEGRKADLDMVIEDVNFLSRSKAGVR